MSFQTPITIKSVIHKIDTNNLLLPAIQREFEWGSEKIELLFDSLMRDYPIGSMLFWRVEGENKSDYRYYTILKEYRERYKVHCNEIDISGISDFLAVLDGQQRLTAIYLGLKGSYAYKLKYFSWKDDENSIPSRKLYLNMNGPCLNNDEDSPEDQRYYNFQFLTKDEFEEEKEQWFEVGKILSLEEIYDLNKFLKNKGWDEDEFKSKALSKLHSIIHTKLLINYYLETSQDYQKALNIFIRINSGGEPLSYSDLVMSTTVAGWDELDARKEIHNLVDFIWYEHGFIIDKDIILRSYLMIFEEDIKFRVTNFKVENAKKFQNNWKTIKECINETFKLIKDFAYVERTLTTKNAILPIIYYLHSTNSYKNFSTKVSFEEDRNTIKKWLHSVLLHKIFGGQAESVLKIIRDCIKEEISKEVKNFPAKKIAESLSKTSNKGINVTEEFIENLLYTQKDDRYAFPILAILYPHMDFKNNDFNIDHIHPIDSFRKKELKKNSKIKINSENQWYYTNSQSYNGIVNLQMLDSNQNKSKSNISLESWVNKNNPDLEKSFIPREYLKLENYQEFYDERFKILKNVLTERLSF